MSIRVPKYRLHKPSGQALVEIQGRRFYLGKHGTSESKEQYRLLVSELLSPQARQNLEPTPSHLTLPTTVSELILAYYLHAKEYYTKNGEPTGEVALIRTSLRRLRQFCGHKEAVSFGPKLFKQLREELIQEDLSLNYINSSMSRIRRMFRWAVAEELIPPSVFQALSAVPGLRKGRSKARETKPIPPVDDATIDATIPHLPKTVADLVRFQRLTGCRPTEACSVRPCDIDRTGVVWLYQPKSHKTQHHGRERVILIGPKGQQLLRPYLHSDIETYCFSPVLSEADRRAEAHAKRTTPLSCGNRPGTKRSRSPKRPAGDCYTKDSYNRAIARACRKAGISKWTPNQLRHAKATELRKAFGLEAAQVTLGHSNANVTQIYAERDLEKAKEIARVAG